MSDLSEFSLEGRRIAVTGANTGIGQGIAVAVARAGGMVRHRPFGDGRDGKNGEGRRRRLPARQSGYQRHGGSVAMLNDLMAEDALDGLVNNAGIIRRADSVDFT